MPGPIQKPLASWTKTRVPVLLLGAFSVGVCLWYFVADARRRKAYAEFDKVYKANKYQKLVSPYQNLSSKYQNLFSQNQNLSSKFQNLSSQIRNSFTHYQKLFSQNLNLSWKFQNLSSRHQNLSSQYRSLFLSPDFSDVVIQIGSEEIPAHKNILAARVPFYKRLFNSGMQEAASNRIIVDPSEEHCFKEVLEYIYCGQFPSDLETDPMKYLPIADMKEMEELKIACSEVMTKLLKQDNFVDFVLAAHAYRCSDLKKECITSLRKWRDTGSFSLAAADLDPLKAHPDLLVDLLLIR